MKRLWSRLGVRVASISLLVAGATGGVYLGLDRDDKPQQDAQARLVFQQTEVDQAQLLAQREAEHAVARAAERKASSVAAARRAAGEARIAAVKAHKVEKKAVEAKKKAEAEKKAAEAAAKKKADEEKAADEDKGGGSNPTFDGPVPASCNEFSGNRKTGCALMIDAGFEIGQFSCLNKLWKKESNWREKAENPSSGAYGIPQSLPGKKMASEGSDWRTSAATQIKWGLGYIEGRYGTPCKAWGHSQDVGWY